MAEMVGKQCRLKPRLPVHELPESWQAIGAQSHAHAGAVPFACTGELVDAEAEPVVEVNKDG